MRRAGPYPRVDSRSSPDALVDADVNELVKMVIASDHAERSISRSDQLAGGFHNAAQHALQRKITAHRLDRAQQLAESALRALDPVGAFDQLVDQLVELELWQVRKVQGVSRFFPIPTGIPYAWPASSSPVNLARC